MNVNNTNPYLVCCKYIGYHTAISDDIIPATVTMFAEPEVSLSLREQCCVYLPQGKYGATPLIVACGENHFEVVSFLIENGADVNLQTKVSFYFCHFHNLLTMLVTSSL